jgi:hypothetical protein
MGQAILYCFSCSTQLRDAHFEQGKAYRIDAWVCCAACAPEAIRSLPPDRVRLLMDLIAAKEKKPAHAPPAPLRESRMNLSPPPMAVPPLPAPSEGRAPLLIGAAVLGILALVAGFVLFGGGNSTRSVRPETPESAGPSTRPPMGTPPPESPALQALRKAVKYGREHPEDFEGQLREYKDLVLLEDKTEAGAEARRAVGALQARERQAIDLGIATLDRDLVEPLRHEEYGKVFQSVEAAKSRMSGFAWKSAVEKRERELRDQLAKLFDALKEKAREAKARGNKAELETLVNRARSLGGAGLAADLARALEALPDPAPPREPAPLRTDEGRTYLARWELAMARATARDYAGAAADLERAGESLKEDAVRQELTQDVRNLKDLEAIYQAAIAALSASRTLAVITIDGREVSGRVVSIDGDRVELVVEPGKPSVFVEWGDVSAPSLLPPLRAQNGAARLLELFLLIEGAAEGAREGISAKYGSYAAVARAKALKPGADELRAREIYYDAERQFRAMSSREKAIEGYKLLRLKFKDTLLVRHALPRIERRGESGREYYFLAVDLASAGTFSLVKEGRLESVAESDPAQANRNWVEWEYLALPPATYRCWALVGGCCAEAFAFHYQATGLTELNPKTRKRAPAEPGGDLASPVKHAIKNLKSTHSKNEPKKPSRWEWVEILLPRSGGSGPKRVRLVTDQQGFAVASVVVSSSRSRPPADLEVADLAKARALDAVPAWAVGRPGGFPRVLVDDFEHEALTWKYVGGGEFPGAKGSMVLDPTVAHEGKGSMKLQADFSGGGAYIGGWRDLPPGRDLKEVHLWVKSSTVLRIMVRMGDGTEQCHQKDLPLVPTKEWQEVVLKFADLAGGQHWGGANDGKLHGPVKAFGIHLTAGSFAGTKTGELWIDDVEGILNVDPADADR